jgi:23S rRNA (cytidine1920-2'-O)/16S rRNA (cytidine1409-2'-O)-methyltransferase
MAAVNASRDRQRLDAALVTRELAPSRARAQALVASGLVEVDGALARSAAQPVGPRSAVRVLGRDHPWAGRGGLKLDAALGAFGVECAGRVCLDAGASTGGFTDVLLSHGAVRVYAVDVGRGLLAARLAADPRVVVMDSTNLRTLESVRGEPPDLFTLDLAFISLRLVMPAVRGLIAPGSPADVVALFKPQFELGREAVGRGGVVRDVAAGQAGADAFLRWVADSHGANIVHEPVPAAVRGAHGNQEWFVHFSLSGAGARRTR